VVTGVTIGLAIFKDVRSLEGLQVYLLPPDTVSWAVVIEQSISFDFLSVIVGSGLTTIVERRVSESLHTESTILTA